MVDVNDIFGSQPVKRVEKPKSVALPKSKQELDSMFDDDFDISDILEVSIDSKTPVKEAPKIDKCDNVDTGKTEKSEVSSGKKPNKSIKHYGKYLLKICVNYMSIDLYLSFILKIYLNIDLLYLKSSPFKLY